MTEMLYNASLLIDDIEDSFRPRRGFLVAHRVYGVPSVFNSANYVYFLRLEKVLTLDPPRGGSCVHPSACGTLPWPGSSHPLERYVLLMPYREPVPHLGPPEDRGPLRPSRGPDAALLWLGTRPQGRYML
uniref:Uncharacterized protein n=1 Tax=Hucho hucho TaxID=62062 RepID=A0A4W5MF96_9TELE